MHGAVLWFPHVPSPASDMRWWQPSRSVVAEGSAELLPSAAGCLSCLCQCEVGVCRVCPWLVWALCVYKAITGLVAFYLRKRVGRWRDLTSKSQLHTEFCGTINLKLCPVPYPQRRSYFSNPLVVAVLYPQSSPKGWLNLEGRPSLGFVLFHKMWCFKIDQPVLTFLVCSYYLNPSITHSFQK